MDAELFEKTLRDIRALNDSEGPSRNIYEPKYEAQKQADMLRQAIEGRLRGEWTLAGQEQLCRVTLFLGNNHYETEDDKEALRMLTSAYTLGLACVRRERVDPSNVPPTPVADVLRVDTPPFTGDFEFVATYTDVLNSLGVFLSQREEQLRIDDARKVLHLAEAAYNLWDAWFLAQPFGCTVQQLTFDESGVLLPLEGGKDARWRHRMEELYVTTLFCLAQAYSIKANVKLASKYCHLTMVRQLLCKKEFNKKDWATNALQLSSFYTSEECFGCALHCLDAGRFVMPTKPADEETLGVVAWSYGKYHKSRLRHYIEGSGGRDATAPGAPAPDELGRAEWWTDFPLPIPPPVQQPSLSGFDALRDEFILANSWFNEAKKYYVIDGSCTDHIKLLQDQSEIMRMLATVEPSLERRIAMHMHRVALFGNLPYELNPQAYTTLIRQLLFDLGDVNSDLLDLRIEQRKTNVGRPFSDKKIGLLCDRAKKCFWDFLASFKEKKDDALPEKVEADLQVPYFRALMRIAGLETKRFHATAQEEYDSIGRAIDRYKQVVSFYHKNAACHAQLAPEVKLAEEMVALLPGKQKEIMRSHARDAAK